MNRISTLCVFLVLCVLPVGLAQAFSETFTVSAQENITKTVKLNDGDEVLGKITVVGTETSAINFSVSDPGNMTILNYQNIGLKEFQFIVSRAGEYTFRFENMLSHEDKHVTLNYNVQHYIFGFPQEFILLFAIVGIALVGIVIFVALSPKP